ncbi:MAG TPA: prolyl oligopeptidase family serine peptidase [Roseiflexaceae bacterium]|nr:prolyl oligopeptidase family serine peptidase [Roseiflexaceae bacterium]
MTETPHTYPPARRDETVEIFHGTPVADPYRWLEDDRASETTAWLAAQSGLTRSFLDAIPERGPIRDRLTQLWDYAKYSLPFERGGHFFFLKNDGLQNQSVLYTQEGPDAPARVLLDPNTLSEDGTAALTALEVSHDGRLLAYGISRSGSDWQELRVRRVDDGGDYDEVIHWCKFTTVAWQHDGSGFFYTRFPEPAGPDAPQGRDSKVYWHRLGTPQEQDALVFERPDAPELGFSPLMTDDGRYLVLHVWRGTDNETRCYYRPADSDGPFVRLLDEADARYQLIEADGDTFYVQTNLDAPRGRVVAIDLARPEREHWRTVVPEQDAVIAYAALVSRRLVLVLTRDVHHEVQVYHLDGGFDRTIALPALGSVTGLSGRPGDRELRIGFASFLYPPGAFRYDFAAGRLLPLRVAEVDFDPDAFETRQTFATSADGTRVPVFVICRRGLALDGSHPTLLYGYGGFNISLMPDFSPSRIAWLEQGGVYAIANLRGGSEYGEAWHRAGMLDQKQRVFDDFVAAAEHLIAQGYTDRRRLAIMGGSNGGLLVAACMLQRPELFGAVICAVPVIDMLRYHHFTVGRYWTGEYGNADEDPEHFRFLLAYSPLHNIRPGAVYPPILILTADTDDRVVPAHARKFAAALQHDAPEGVVLLRVEQRAGHGHGRPTAKVIEETADVYAFLLKVLHGSA